MRRLLTGAICVPLAGAVVAGGPAPAHADESQHLTITGVSLAEPLEVHADERPELFTALYREVDWLIDEDGDAEEPEDADELGNQFTMEIFSDGEAQHRFHLFPRADGGPRVFRPAEQPGDRTVDEAWHHGRVSMAETLASAGVPMADSETGPQVPGGAGGGDPVPTEEAAGAERGPLGFLADWREGMLLTGAVTVAIALGLAGVALLIRRKV